MPTLPFLLSVAQMRRLSPHFPLCMVSRGWTPTGPRWHHLRHPPRPLQWRDALTSYGSHKTLYNRFIRWGRMGVFDRIFAVFAGKGGLLGWLMIDSTHLKVHRTAASLLQKGLFPATSVAPRAT